MAARAHGTFLERDEFALAAAGQSFCVRGSFSDGQLGPTNTARSVRKVSLRYPVIEARPEWSPTAAGIGPRQVLDGLQVLCLATVDAEARLWSMTSSQFARVWKRILTMAGVRYRHPAKPQRPDPRRPEAGGWSTAITLLKTYAHWVPDEEPASSPASTAVTPQPRKTAGLLL